LLLGLMAVESEKRQKRTHNQNKEWKKKSNGLEKKEK